LYWCGRIISIIVVVGILKKYLIIISDWSFTLKYNGLIFLRYNLYSVYILCLVFRELSFISVIVHSRCTVLIPSLSHKVIPFVAFVMEIASSSVHVSELIVNELVVLVIIKFITELVIIIVELVIIIVVIVGRV